MLTYHLALGESSKVIFYYVKIKSKTYCVHCKWIYRM